MGTGEEEWRVKGDKERTKGKQGVETERKRHLLMVIFSLMSNSSIGVRVIMCLCFSVCVCAQERGAAAAERRKSEKPCD